jgi:hypothetical protein
LTFFEHGMTDVFAHKNNKTVRETLAHERYSKLARLIVQDYSAGMDIPLGAFLLNYFRAP